MTFYQAALLEEAIDMWSRGFRIPTDLFAKMAAEGMDVQTLEENHYKDPNHG